MYHIIEENRLYDFINEMEIEVNLFKGKQKYDIIQFLDDISMWMEHNKELISDKYLPLSILSVGIAPSQVSAFLYGIFVGKALEKNKTKVDTKQQKVTKEEIFKVMDESVQDYSKIIKDFFKKEKDPDDPKEKPKK